MSFFFESLVDPYLLPASKLALRKSLKGLICCSLVKRTWLAMFCMILHIRVRPRFIRDVGCWSIIPSSHGATATQIKHGSHIPKRRLGQSSYLIVTSVSLISLDLDKSSQNLSKQIILGLHMGPNHLCYVTSLFIFFLCPHVTFYKTLTSLSTLFIKGHIGFLQLLKWQCRTSVFTHVDP